RLAEFAARGQFRQAESIVTTIPGSDRDGLWLRPASQIPESLQKENRGFCHGATRPQLTNSVGLRAAFPLAAAAQPVADCGEERCAAVKNSCERKKQRPDRRQPVERNRWQEGGCHETPRQKRGKPELRLRSECERHGNQKRQRQTDQRADQL